MNVLSMEGVYKSYRRKGFLGIQKKDVLKDFNLQVSKGRIFGLLGLNGSGKTTTLKLVLGFLHADRGTVNLLGQTMPSRKPLRQVGFLPELPFLTPHLTGRELLSFFYDCSFLPRDKKKIRLHEVIERTGLDKMVDRLVGEYSKGMRQRLVLAQALLHNPDFFVLDEPTSGLDAKTAKEMAVLIFALKRDQKTVLLSSHNISFVERVCDQVGILAHGHIIKILEKKDWQVEGGLEPLFLQEVRDTGEVGPIQVDVY